MVKKMWKKELLNMKNKIKTVAFKKSFSQGYYVLSAIGNDGCILIGKYGLAKYDIWQDDIENAIIFLKNNGFVFHEHSIIKA